MFRHLFIYKLKILLKNKSMLFWTLAFPFVLGTFFQLALSNIDKTFELEEIPIAIISNEDYDQNETLKTIIYNLSEGNNKIFDVKYVNENEAKNLLKNNKINAYIYIENGDPKLTVKENGINQTIIKNVLDQYYQMNSVVESIAFYNQESLYDGTLEFLYKDTNYLEDNSTEKIDFSVNYFFTLIAMACLYGSLIGLEVIKDCEANLSYKGARICIAPVSKIKTILAGLLAGYIIQLIALALLFAYLIFVLKVNFGNQILPTIILSIVGCLAGTSLGTFVGVSNKKSEGFKLGVLMASIMSCCFFAGMMGSPQMKVIFHEKLPLLSTINPICMITDGLYSLFAYDTLNVYYTKLISISIFTIIMIVLSIVFIRRKSYDSI